MSGSTPFPTALNSGTRLISRLVWFFVCWALLAGWCDNASAGCYFGHAQPAKYSESFNPAGYARNFRILGQWIYEAGQIKYVAWQAEGECHGPNCSAGRPDHDDNGGMSLPRQDRPHSAPAHHRALASDLLPQMSAIVGLEDVKARAGYPHAYEYPP